jgi:hypothetical protein
MSQRSGLGGNPNSGRVGMPAFAQTPVLPEAPFVGALSAHLRRSYSRPAMSSKRRLQPPGLRNSGHLPGGERVEISNAKTWALRS